MAIPGLNVIRKGQMISALPWDSQGVDLNGLTRGWVDSESAKMHPHLLCLGHFLIDSNRAKRNFIGLQPFCGLVPSYCQYLLKTGTYQNYT